MVRTTQFVTRYQLPRLQSAALASMSKIRHLPIALAMGWSILTVLMFAFGPFHYRVDHPEKLYLYLLAAHIAIWVGYQGGVRAKMPERAWSGNIGNLVAICMIASILKLVLDYALGVKYIAIATGINDPYLAREIENARPADYLGIFLAPLTYCTIPLTIYYWHKVHPLVRLGFCILVIDVVVGSISTATRSGILALLVFAGGPFLCKDLGRFFSFKRLRIVAICAIVLSVFLVYGTFITERRSSTRAVSYEVRLQARSDTSFDFTHPLYLSLPESVRPGLLEFSYYYSHGYSWLAKSLDKPFQGVAFGVGHSRFLTRNAERYFGDSSILNLSYFYRLNLEDGMLLSRWITLYPWIASDVTFPGSIIVLYLFGNLFGRTWRETQRGNNPYAVVLFTLLLFQFTSISQVAITQDGPLAFAFYSLLFLWLRGKTGHAPMRRLTRA